VPQGDDALGLVVAVLGDEYPFIFGIGLDLCIGAQLLLAVLVIPGKAAFGPRLLLLGGGRGGDLSVGELLAAAQRGVGAAETPDGRLSKGLICRFLRPGSLH